MELKEPNDKGAEHIISVLTREIESSKLNKVAVIIGNLEYVILSGNFYIEGPFKPDRGYSLSVTSDAQGKQKSQMEDLLETGIPFHRMKDKGVIIDCNLIIKGSLTAYPRSLPANETTSD